MSVACELKCFTNKMTSFRDTLNITCFNYSSNNTIWVPKSNDVICSNYFVDGYKSSELLNPNYVLTIFPDIYKKRTINPSTITDRYEK